jgi:hypothetical protein
MELAPADPEVQVVVQAEFSPVDLQYSPCPSCQAPSTFRYRVEGTGNTRVGPDGPVEIIGNRDMTAAASLREFLAWGREQYPAEHYALILWNHGGGYKGLIEDKTSAGSAWMPLSTLREGLTGGAPLDLIDFDMCLMGSADVLELIRGNRAVSSCSRRTWSPAPESVCGDHPRGQVDPSASPQAGGGPLGRGFLRLLCRQPEPDDEVRVRHGSVREFQRRLARRRERVSPTRWRPIAFWSAWPARRARSSPCPSSRTWSTGRTRWRCGRADPALKAQLAASRRRRPRRDSASRCGTGTAPIQLPWVRRANGLSLLLPSGSAFDAMPSDGPASFQAYQQLLPDHPWTRMLAAHLVGAPVRGYRDLSPHRYETYLVVGHCRRQVEGGRGPVGARARR